MKKNKEKMLLKSSALEGFNKGWKRSVFGVIFEICWFVVQVFLWIYKTSIHLWLHVKINQLVRKKIAIRFMMLAQEHL